MKEQTQNIMLVMALLLLVGTCWILSSPGIISDKEFDVCEQVFFGMQSDNYLGQSNVVYSEAYERLLNECKETK